MSDNELGLLSYGQTRVLVDDFATSFRFYRDVLGLPLKDAPGDAPRSDDGPYACFAVQGNDLALFTRAYLDAAIGAEHRQRPDVDGVVIVLRVENVDAAAKILRARGVDLVSEPADQAAWGMRVMHLRAPEGTLIELCEY
ncbi:VOC family protein [Nocardia inohanensis]|uniref:VOC family protein n=1 Tax=Nocardia inohanensis TaxID=209246 RepID=UPI000A00CB68|nr:VOC family protein [Nocardia inohanensis]